MENGIPDVRRTRVTMRRSVESEMPCAVASDVKNLAFFPVSVKDRIELGMDRNDPLVVRLLVLHEDLALGEVYVIEPKAEEFPLAQAGIQERRSQRRKASRTRRSVAS
jgi:hypothetical protein